MSERRAPYDGKPVTANWETEWNEKQRLVRQRNLWALAFFLLVIDFALWFGLSHYNWLWVNGTALACGTCAITVFILDRLPKRR